MPYLITNLILTRHDPLRRGNKPLLARRPITISQRVIKPGQSITISDPVYEKIKANIDQYAALGLIKLVKLPTMVGHVAPVEGTLIEDAPELVPSNDVLLTVDPQNDDSLKINTDATIISDEASQVAAFAEPEATVEASPSTDEAVAETTQEEVVEEVKPTKRRRSAL